MEFRHEEEHVDNQMIVIQANIDDMNPEWCSHVTDLLFIAGAHDAYWIPIIMKKGRPGLMLNVLVREEQLSAMEHVVFTETTTLGLRYVRASCHRLGRESFQVLTQWGEVAVKAGFYQGEMVQFAPEFSDCQRVAKQHNVPLKTVYEEVRQQFRRQQG